MCESCENLGYIENVCSTCSGSGEGSYDGVSCHSCHGAGVVSEICECECCDCESDDFDAPDDCNDAEADFEHEGYVESRY